MFAVAIPIAGGVQPENATAKIAHMAVTPHGENGVGDVKVRASIMSGGLVIQRPPTCTTTATDQRASDPMMRTPSTMGSQPG